jgi:hypothetical protein
MKINPNLTGGEAAEQIVMKSYTLVVRKPVFDGLIGKKKQGFVQIDWRGDLPDIISDTIDYNLDNKPDFVINISRSASSTILKPLNPKVRKVGISTPTSYGWSARIKIEK